MILATMIKLLPSKPVYAHCDVPCGIYDPRSAQIAAATVLKMVQKLKELQKPEDDDWMEYKNSMTRMILTKEEHAQKCKEELLILWTDYFKSEHLKKYPELHDTFWKAAKLCSQNKQHVDEEMANQLVTAVDSIADIFTATKKA